MVSTQREAAALEPVSEQCATDWVVQQKLRDVVAEGQEVRAYRALRAFHFGPAVTDDLKVEFWRLVAPMVHRLAVDQYDLGKFEDSRFTHHIEVEDQTQVTQGPMRMDPEAERWLLGTWLVEQEKKGLIKKAGIYERCPFITQLLLVPGT